MFAKMHVICTIDAVVVSVLYGNDVTCKHFKILMFRSTTAAAMRLECNYQLQKVSAVRLVAAVCCRTVAACHHKSSRYHWRCAAVLATVSAALAQER